VWHKCESCNATDFDSDCYFGHYHLSYLLKNTTSQKLVLLLSSGENRERVCLLCGVLQTELVSIAGHLLKFLLNNVYSDHQISSVGRLCK
jgi:hypothetical protein